MRCGDVESNPGPLPPRLRNIKSLKVRWEDGRTSLINPKDTDAGEVKPGDVIPIRWGKKRKIYHGEVIEVVEHPTSPQPLPMPLAKVATQRCPPMHQHPWMLKAKPAEVQPDALHRASNIWISSNICSQKNILQYHLLPLKPTHSSMGWCLFLTY